MFLGLYERYVFLLDSLAVDGRSRDEVAAKLRAEIRASSGPAIPYERRNTWHISVAPLTSHTCASDVDEFVHQKSSCLSVTLRHE